MPPHGSKIVLAKRQRFVEAEVSEDAPPPVERNEVLNIKTDLSTMLEREPLPYPL